jgi:fucose permease
MDEVKNLIGKILSALPLKKLSANQTFDLCCDVLMVALVLIGLIKDLGPHQAILKPILLFCSVGFIAWSFAVNR